MRGKIEREMSFDVCQPVNQCDTKCGYSFSFEWNYFLCFKVVDHTTQGWSYGLHIHTKATGLV